MEDHKEGRVTWDTWDEEVEALRKSPVAQSLLRALDSMEQERKQQPIETLTTFAGHEEVGEDGKEK